MRFLIESQLFLIMKEESCGVLAQFSKIHSILSYVCVLHAYLQSNLFLIIEILCF